LQQHGKFWKELCNDETLRAEVPEWISMFNTWQPCLIVGIMIAEDVELDYSGSTEKEIGGKIQAPLATIALTASGVPLPTDKGNLQATAGSHKQVATVFKAKSETSSIFALELKVVTTTLVRRKQLQLSKSGPRVDKDRLAGAGESSESEDETDVRMENVVLEGFSDREYTLLSA
jgi:hypothetical protein